MGVNDEEKNPSRTTLLFASILRDGGGTGVQTHVREFRTYLEAHGTSAPLVTPFSWGGAFKVPAFGARPVIQRISSDAGVAWYRYWHELFLRNALRQRLAKLGDVVVYAHGPEAARACLQARKGPHQRVAMAVHYDTSQTEGWIERGFLTRDGRAFRAIRQMEHQIVPRVDAIVYVSNWSRDRLWQWLPEAERVPHETIHNFVKSIDTLPSNEPLGDLVTVGSLDPAKRHEFLLELLAAARRMGHPLTLDIYGDGPLSRPLKQLAEELGVAQAVRFRGYCPDVRRLLPRYRAYVHGCLSETGPIAIIEAMAAGLPILAPKAGGIPELFDDGVEGRYCSADDPVLAAGTAITVLSDEDVRSRHAAAALQRFRSEFDVDLVGPQLRSYLFAVGASPDTSVSSVNTGNGKSRFA